jgi:Zc3h12a-like Ribonuclease NYN domain
MFKMLFSLPFADLTTISIGGSPDLAAGSGQVSGVVLLALAVAVGIILVGLVRLARSRGRRRGNWIVVDGSNVMHWQGNTPRLETVLQVVKDLQARGFDPGVVFDANAGWKLFGKYLNEAEFGRRLGLPKDQVLVVPKGTQADPYILFTARKFNARIVTNDRYRDWADAHPEVAQPGFLIRGEIQGDAVRLQGIDVTPVS